MAVYGLEVPFGLLKSQFVLLGVFLLFALPLARRCTVVALLLQLLTVLFYEFLDFPTLLIVVVRRVVHWATCTSAVAARCLTGALVTSGPWPPPVIVANATAVGALANGWLLSSAFSFFLFLLLPP
jgi:hypothetical protein